MKKTAVKKASDHRDMDMHHLGNSPALCQQVRLLKLHCYDSLIIKHNRLYRSGYVGLYFELIPFSLHDTLTLEWLFWYNPEHISIHFM